MLDYVLPVLNFTGKKELRLYIDNGGKGLEAELQPGIDEMLAALESKELVNGRNLLYYVDPPLSTTNRHGQKEPGAF
jgi:hypothetical protein